MGCGSSAARTAPDGAVGVRADEKEHAHAHTTSSPSPVSVEDVDPNGLTEEDEPLELGAHAADAIIDIVVDGKQDDEDEDEDIAPSGAATNMHHVDGGDPVDGTSKSGSDGQETPTLTRGNSLLKSEVAKDEKSDQHDPTLNFRKRYRGRVWTLATLNSLRQNILKPERLYEEVRSKEDGAWKHEWSAMEGKEEVARPVVKREAGETATVRVFISSTFVDTFNEREILVKRALVELRELSLKRQIQLFECDLRWGVPAETRSDDTIRICLSEIDRCANENAGFPFFLCIISERYGWIPPPGDVPVDIRKKWNWRDGFSITTHEILHGAFRRRNPNAFFVMRSPSFLEEEEFKGLNYHHRAGWVDLFRDERGVPTDLVDQKMKAKRDALKDNIRKMFGGKKDQVLDGYKCTFRGMRMDKDGLIRVRGLDDMREFAQEKLWAAIQSQYPEIKIHLSERDISPHASENFQHKSFMKTKSAAFIGRSNLVSVTCDVALGCDDLDQSKPEFVRLSSNAEGKNITVVTGEPGSGKSALMAKISSTIAVMNERVHFLFTHFVSVAPKSTELQPMVTRLNGNALESLHGGRSNVSSAGAALYFQQKCQMLKRNLKQLAESNEKLVVIIIDAVNQFEDQSLFQRLDWWIPNVHSRIRIVMSTLKGETLNNLTALSPNIVSVGPLDQSEQETLVTEQMAKYNKVLDANQMALLMAKTGASNPLWLALAVEELRVHGSFETATQKISSLNNSVADLIGAVLRRMEEQHGVSLVRDFMCLVYCSRSGLYEFEVRELLSQDGSNPLPASAWAWVHRDVAFCLRSRGESGEGIVDFNHQQMRFAVYDRYLSATVAGTPVSVGYHGKLAKLFKRESVKVDTSVGAGEFPRALRELSYHQVCNYGGLLVYGLWNDLSFHASATLPLQRRAGVPLDVMVAVRVRPLNDAEKKKGAQNVISMEGSQTTITNPTTGEKNKFNFDFSFWSVQSGEDSAGGEVDDKADDTARADENIGGVVKGERNTSTDESDSGPWRNALVADGRAVFDLLGKEVLNNLFEGYNVSFFAYGQTGSGKTHSIFGHPNTASTSEALVPLVCREIFYRVEEGTKLDVKFEIQVTMIEIYKERIYDLLGDKQERFLREDTDGATFIADVSMEKVSNYADIEKVLEKGGKLKTVSATEMNARSSRAHTMITLQLKEIETVNDAQTRTTISKVHFVDLAGSERARTRGNVSSEVEKEGIAINLSLTMLNRCLRVLSSGKKAALSHIPWRDSLITRILRDALGGGSKLIVLAAISPADTNYPETLSTLRYASAAKKIDQAGGEEEDKFFERDVDSDRSDFETKRVKLDVLMSKLWSGIKAVKSDLSAVLEASHKMGEYGWKYFVNLKRTFPSYVSDDLLESVKILFPNYEATKSSVRSERADVSLRRNRPGTSDRAKLQRPGSAGMRRVAAGGATGTSSSGGGKDRGGANHQQLWVSVMQDVRAEAFPFLAMSATISEKMAVEAMEKNVVMREFNIDSLTAEVGGVIGDEKSRLHVIGVVQWSVRWMVSMIKLSRSWVHFIALGKAAVEEIEGGEDDEGGTGGFVDGKNDADVSDSSYRDCWECLAKSSEFWSGLLQVRRSIPSDHETLLRKWRRNGGWLNFEASELNDWHAATLCVYIRHIFDPHDDGGGDQNRVSVDGDGDSDEATTTLLGLDLHNHLFGDAAVECLVATCCDIGVGFLCVEGCANTSLQSLRLATEAMQRAHTEELDIPVVLLSVEETHKGRHIMTPQIADAVVESLSLLKADAHPHIQAMVLSCLLRSVGLFRPVVLAGLLQIIGESAWSEFGEKASPLSDSHVISAGDGSADGMKHYAIGDSAAAAMIRRFVLERMEGMTKTLFDGCDELAVASALVTVMSHLESRCSTNTPIITTDEDRDLKRPPSAKGKSKTNSAATSAKKVVKKESSTTSMTTPRHNTPLMRGVVDITSVGRLMGQLVHTPMLCDEPNEKVRAGATGTKSGRIAKKDSNSATPAQERPWEKYFKAVAEASMSAVGGGTLGVSSLVSSAAGSALAANVTAVLLDGVGLGDGGCVRLCAALRSSNHVTYLSLRNNNLSDMSVQSIVQLGRDVGVLQMVNVENNQNISPNALAQVISTFVFCKTSSSVEVDVALLSSLLEKPKLVASLLSQAASASPHNPTATLSIGVPSHHTLEISGMKSARIVSEYCRVLNLRYHELTIEGINIGEPQASTGRDVLDRMSADRNMFSGLCLSLTASANNQRKQVTNSKTMTAGNLPSATSITSVRSGRNGDGDDVGFGTVSKVTLRNCTFSSQDITAVSKCASIGETLELDNVVIDEANPLLAQSVTITTGEFRNNVRYDYKLKSAMLRLPTLQLANAVVSEGSAVQTVIIANQKLPVGPIANGEQRQVQLKFTNLTDEKLACVFVAQLATENYQKIHPKTTVDINGESYPIGSLTSVKSAITKGKSASSNDVAKLTLKKPLRSSSQSILIFLLIHHARSVHKALKAVTFDLPGDGGDDSPRAVTENVTGFTQDTACWSGNTLDNRAHRAHRAMVNFVFGFSELCGAYRGLAMFKYWMLNEKRQEAYGGCGNSVASIASAIAFSGMIKGLTSDGLNWENFRMKVDEMPVDARSVKWLAATVMPLVNTLNTVDVMRRSSRSPSFVLDVTPRGVVSVLHFRLSQSRPPSPPQRKLTNGNNDTDAHSSSSAVWLPTSRCTNAYKRWDEWQLLPFIAQLTMFDHCHSLCLNEPFSNPKSPQPMAMAALQEFYSTILLRSNLRTLCVIADEAVPLKDQSSLLSSVNSDTAGPWWPGQLPLTPDQEQPRNIPLQRLHIQSRNIGAARQLSSLLDMCASLTSLTLVQQDGSSVTPALNCISNPKEIKLLRNGLLACSKLHTIALQGYACLPFPLCLPPSVEHALLSLDPTVAFPPATVDGEECETLETDSSQKMNLKSLWFVIHGSPLRKVGKIPQSLIEGVDNANATIDVLTVEGVSRDVTPQLSHWLSRLMSGCKISPKKVRMVAGFGTEATLGALKKSQKKVSPSEEHLLTCRDFTVSIRCSDAACGRDNLHEDDYDAKGFSPDVFGSIRTTDMAHSLVSPHSTLELTASLVHEKSGLQVRRRIDVGTVDPVKDVGDSELYRDLAALVGESMSGVGAVGAVVSTLMANRCSELAGHIPSETSSETSGWKEASSSQQQDDKEASGSQQKDDNRVRVSFGNGTNSGGVFNTKWNSEFLDPSFYCV